jgi:hypothetical protein
VKRAVLVLLSAAVSAAVFAFDSAAFHPATFKNFQRQQPAPSEGRDFIFDTAMPALAVGVKYSGATRSIAAPRAAQIERVARSLHKPEFRTLYRKEIEVVEQGRSYWLPIQDQVLSELARVLNPGQEFTVYVRYAGASFAGSDRLYLLIDFDAGPPKPLPRDTCFARQLFGIALGRPLAPVLEGLKAKYGEPHVMRRGQETLHVFLVDLESQTYVVVGDAGQGYRDRVFSVQLTGQPGQRPAVFRTLRFGAPSSEVEGVFGKPVDTVSSGEGYTRLVLPHSTCSVELKNGVFASILIADDPNYFQEE